MNRATFKSHRHGVLDMRFPNRPAANEPMRQTSGPRVPRQRQPLMNKAAGAVLAVVMGVLLFAAIAHGLGVLFR